MKKRADVIKTASSLAIFVMAILLPLSPWIWRNYTTFHTIVPVSTNGGYNLLCGNNSNGTIVWLSEKVLLNFENMPSQKQWTKLDEIEQNKIFQKHAIEHIVTYPGDFIKKIPRKFYMLMLSPDVPWLYWNMEGIKKDTKLTGISKILLSKPSLTIIAATSRIFWYSILTLSMIYLLYYYKNNDTLFFANILMIFWIIIHIIYWGKARFRFPFYPFLIVMTASTCYYLIIEPMKKKEKK